VEVVVIVLIYLFGVYSVTHHRYVYCNVSSLVALYSDSQRCTVETRI